MSSNLPKTPMKAGLTLLHRSPPVLIPGFGQHRRVWTTSSVCTHHGGYVRTVRVCAHHAGYVPLVDHAGYVPLVDHAGYETPYHAGYETPYHAGICTTLLPWVYVPPYYPGYTYHRPLLHGSLPYPAWCQLTMPWAQIGNIPWVRASLRD